MKAIFILVIVFFVAIVSYASWQIGRRINYKFSYQSMVQEEVRRMVRPEALK